LTTPFDEVSELVGRLNGSFCIVLADLKTGSVKLISDRFGSHPMFYALSDDFVFGSQAIAVLQSPSVSSELDIKSLLQLLAFQKVFGTRTLEKNIDILPPASILTFDGEVSIAGYWERRFHPLELKEEEFAEEMAATFSRSLSRIGGNNPAIMLSGGLDSRMVFAACEKPPACLTIGDYVTSEYRIASRIAQMRGVGTRLLLRDADHYVRLVDEAVRIGSGMYIFFHAHSLGFLESLNNDVMLHGYGVESFFRGTRLPKKLHKIGRLRLANSLTSISEETFSSVVKEMSYYSLMGRNPSQLLTPDLSRQFLATVDESIDSYRQAAAKESSSLYDQFLYYDTGHPTKNAGFLLQLAFRPYIREGGLVFDNDIHDLYLKMPVWARANDRIWLKALFRINPDIAIINNANTGWHHRMPMVLTQILNAPKNLRRRYKRARTEWEYYQSDGSYPHFGMLLKHNTKMRDMVASAIDDLNPSLFDIVRLKELFDAQMAGKKTPVRFLYLALTISRWQSMLKGRAPAKS
jgi:asparagine synthase (glutamine-hydrolysing)